MTVTAHSSDVDMPCGHYAKIAQILRGKITLKGMPHRNRWKAPYKRTRPTQRMKRQDWLKGVLADAAINDPDDRQELWSW